MVHPNKGLVYPTRDLFTQQGLGPLNLTCHVYVIVLPGPLACGLDEPSEHVGLGPTAQPEDPLPRELDTCTSIHATDSQSGHPHNRQSISPSHVCTAARCAMTSLVSFPCVRLVAVSQSSVSPFLCRLTLVLQQRVDEARLLGGDDVRVHPWAGHG